MRTSLTLIAAAFALLAPPAGAQETRGLPSLEDMQRIVTQMREQTYTPGAAVSGWDQGGANPDAVLRAAGVDRFYYLIHRTGGDSVAILTDRAIGSFVPDGWRVVDTYGDSSTRVDNGVVQFEALSSRYVMAVRAGTTRRRDADCIAGLTNATLYERPGATAGDDDDTIPLFFRLGLLAAEGQTVCTRYEGSRAAGWRGRNFTTDGRSLPQLDDEAERITIVPAAPIGRLIVYRAPATPAPPGT